MTEIEIMLSNIKKLEHRKNKSENRILNAEYQINEIQKQINNIYKKITTCSLCHEWILIDDTRHHKHPFSGSYTCVSCYEQYKDKIHQHDNIMREYFEKNREK